MQDQIVLDHMPRHVHIVQTQIESALKLVVPKRHVASRGNVLEELGARTDRQLVDVLIHIFVSS
jgi:hypothetical protein